MKPPRWQESVSLGPSAQNKATLPPSFDFGSTQWRDKGWWGARIPAGLEARGEGGNRVELVEESRGRRLRKKLLSSPHLRDSTRVVFPDPE